ncbi:hypothetical protein [Bradyrhizobium lablabi]|uniref:hypothetical protein n=1 Tax=Bradyrhizobium lablabi TaxID=722472 RepID=UPI00090B9B1C|nr:hypothetical protein [Bradyrhizobium lablabi]SHL47060.1 hypothetical protein SAMN05444321_3003 [Bradyrhizobium lablabi]
MFLRVGFSIGLAVCAAGCAIRPLPEQVTGVKTDEIVKHIRCEAREAIKLKASDYLSFHTEDAAAIALSQALASEDYVFDRNQFLRLSSQPRLMLAKVGSSAVAYNFTFDMTEINNLDPAWDGIAGIPNGTFGLGITAGVDRTRHSIRSFTVSDTFVGLLTKVTSDYCKDRTPKGPNYLYPIVGKTGVAEMIDTFIDTSLFDNLAKSDKGPPAISDSIEFQTNLSLGITPSVALTRVTNRLTTKDATFGIVNKRQDSHKVIVGLSRDDTAATPAALLWLVNGSSKSTPAEGAALTVVDKHILRFEVGQRALILGQ